MKKQINEASVLINIQGLESNDLEQLSRVLALAGQAEKNAVASTIPQMRPLDLDSIGGDDVTQPIMDPADAMSADEMGAHDDLGGAVTDFGAESDLGVDMGDDSGVDSLELTDSSPDFGSDDISAELDSDYTGDDDFDMGRMSSLAGIHESQDVQEDSDVPDDSEDDDSDEDQSVDSDLSENRMLPDLSLDEDSIASDANEEHGPFRTEFDCVSDGQQSTNGVEGDNFIVVPKGNAFYWKRTMQEDADNRPEPEFYDDEGIRNSRHEYRHKRTALGDNPILSVNEEDEDESVDTIFESITDKYKKFMEGL